MRKFHIAIGVSDVEESVSEYSRRLDAKPVLVVPGEYALWRTEQVNFSIRKVEENFGRVRHIGWEDSSASDFSNDIDLNGMMWETFSAKNQSDEIATIWPQAGYKLDDG